MKNPKNRVPNGKSRPESNCNPWKALSQARSSLTSGPTNGGRFYVHELLYQLPEEEGLGDFIVNPHISPISVTPPSP